MSKTRTEQATARQGVRSPESDARRERLRKRLRARFRALLRAERAKLRRAH